MIYSSSEGEEKLFPEYFPLPASRRLHPDRPASRRVADTFQKISFDPARKNADLMGSINAGWADMGLHPETFWLGYATSAAAAWHPGAPDPAESMAAFYPLFYGHRVSHMDRVYQLMSTQAQFWSDSWETSPSNARKPIWGNSNGLFEQPRPARDQSIPLPPLPGGGPHLPLRMDGAECRTPATGLRVSGGERRTARASSRQSAARRSEFLQPGSLSLDRASLPAESGNAAEHRAHRRVAEIGL